MHPRSGRLACNQDARGWNEPDYRAWFMRRYRFSKSARTYPAGSKAVRKILKIIVHPADLPQFPQVFNLRLAFISIVLEI
jgi:hypothetical protein